MPTLDTSCTALTYEQPVDNRLGDFGVAFPVGLVLYITTSSTVLVTTAITDDQMKGTAGANNIDAGSGDNGLALFRRGKTYTITAGEQTLIDAAGYSACTSA
jgi:hypothetical protein